MLQKIPPHHTTSSSIKQLSRPCPKQSSVVLPSLQLEAQHAVPLPPPKHSPAQISVAQLFHLFPFPFLAILLHTHRRLFPSHWLLFLYPRHLQSLLSANSKPSSFPCPFNKGGLGPCRPLFFFCKAQPNLVLSKRSLSWGILQSRL